VHSDSAPTVYVNGNPEPTNPTLRQLERDTAAAQALDPYVSDQKTPIALYLADKVGQKALHMQTADLQRSPSFTLFANPDYFLTAGVTSNPVPGTPTKFNCPDAASPAFVCVDYHFAWSHGDATDDIGRTWLGMVRAGRPNARPDQQRLDRPHGHPAHDARARGPAQRLHPDGRVITQFLEKRALPHGDPRQAACLDPARSRLQGDQRAVRPALVRRPQRVDEGALERKRAQRQHVRRNFERITSLTNDRNALGAQMRDVLNNAAFGGPVPSASQIQALVIQGDALLTHANQLGVGYSP
jgi:hypothetical protein